MVSFCKAQISASLKAPDLILYSFCSLDTELQNTSRIIENALFVKKLWLIQKCPKIVGSSFCDSRDRLRRKNFVFKTSQKRSLNAELSFCKTRQHGLPPVKVLDFANFQKMHFSGILYWSKKFQNSVFL